MKKLALLLLLTACGARDDSSLIATSRRVFGPLPPPKVEDARLVDLGRQLYFSNDLSLNRTQSCNSCHPVDAGGADRQRVSTGALGHAGRRNAPTVFNTDLHVAQFWDGRAKTLEEQALGPMLNRDEMAMPDAARINERIHPVTLDQAARAIAAYERTLRTHDRFDDYMNGNRRALTAKEKQGLREFMALGCTSCHNGPAVGARVFQRFGIVHPYPTADRGRFELTRDPADDRVFKVPSLRNVALTPPYFHDGSAPDLPTAVEKMAWHQLGMHIQPQDRDAIVAFLNALSAKGRAGA